MHRKISDLQSLLTLLFTPEKGKNPAEIPATFSDQLYQDILTIRCELMDHHNGIHSSVLRIGDKDIWLRSINESDLNKSNPQQDPFIYYNYLRIFYSYLLAAITISDIEEQKNNMRLIKELQDLKLKTRHAFDVIIASQKQVNIKQVMQMLEEAKGELLGLLTQYIPHIDTVAMSKMLDQAKNWVSLTKPSMPVITMVKTNALLADKTFIIIDSPCTNLTPEQKKYFQHLPDQLWFRELAHFEQQLVQYYEKAILSDKCVIPSQLRSIIPTNKNSYHQSIWIKEGSQFELINDYFHSGTVAHLSHKDQQLALGITQESLKQQKLNCSADGIVMISLNSEISDWIIGPYEYIRGHTYIPDDSNIVNLTSRAADSLQTQQIYAAKICLNGFRMMEWNDYNGIDQLLVMVKENIALLNPHLLIVQQIQNHIRQIELFKRQVNDMNVKGLDIIFLLTQIARLNNQLAENYIEKPIKTVAIWFGCASGENRTGITYYHNIYQTLADYIEQTNKIKLTENNRQAIKNLIAATQHISIVTALGRAFGAEGVRRKSSGSFKRNDPIEFLISPSADLKTLRAQDYTFNSALENLQNALQMTKHDYARQPIWYWAKQFAQDADQHRYQVVHMIPEDKKLYIASLTAVTHVLHQPTHISTLTQLQTCVSSMAQRPTFKGKNHPHIPELTLGILIGCLGAALITFSVLSLVGVVTAPVSIGGIAIGALLMTHAYALTSLAGGGLLLGSAGILTKQGLFNYKKGPFDYLQNVKGTIKNSIT